MAWVSKKRWLEMERKIANLENRTKSWKYQNPQQVEEAKAGIASTHILMDKEFNVAMHLDIKKIIAEVFLDMSYNMSLYPQEKREEFVKRKAHQMKEELSKFIDAQVELTQKNFNKF